MELDGDCIRFTPDGRVAVVDAIRALSEQDGADRIWESLKQACPEFRNICQGYHFKAGQMDSVVDGHGWEKIEAALLDYMKGLHSAK
jgi:hypothetical protein